MKFKIVTECLFDIKDWYNFPLVKSSQTVTKCLFDIKDWYNFPLMKSSQTVVLTPNTVDSVF